jgi:hypothetical protein
MKVCHDARFHFLVCGKLLSHEYISHVQVGLANLVSYEVQKLANNIEALVSKQAAVRMMIKQRGIVTQSMKPLLKVRFPWCDICAFMFAQCGC